MPSREPPASVGVSRGGAARAGRAHRAAARDRPDVPPAGGRGDPDNRPHPGRRHVDVHDRRRAVARPAVGRAVHPDRRLPSGRVDRARALPGRPGRADRGHDLRVVPSPGDRRSDRGVAGAWRVRRVSAGAGAPSAAHRHGTVRTDALPRRRSRCAPAAVVVRRPDRRPVGERPRQLLPGAGRARARLDRGRRRTVAAPATSRWPSRS